MKTANPGLQAVEYLFVGISMVGIAIATLTQEITYAAIPLMITLLLNIFNRQQVEENILLLEQKLLEKPQEEKEVHQESPNVDYSLDIKTLQAKIENTEATISQFQQDLQKLAASFDNTELKAKIEGFQTTLSHWQARLDSLNAVDLNPLQEQLANLQQRLDSFAQVQAEILQLKQNQQNLERTLENSQSEIHQAFNLIQSLPTRSELEQLKQSLDSLTYLKNEVNNFVHQDSFNVLSGDFNNLVQQFNHRPEGQMIESLSNEVKKLSESLSNLNFDQFGEQIKNLREQFEAIPQKDLLETLTTQQQEINTIQQQIENLPQQNLTNSSRKNPKIQQRIFKRKPRRVRINKRRK
ncbi:hypothetical protein [Gloeothece verrucosa]|uniref:Uncharacterized protein n=1 Tax=Gloeothece verrucosa (strain PCC 7822) TaxID=497965 RepID=E0U9F2_GLOV7|nr:hypothetical protein [Gloeothece verrucosa]ADN12644.1 hypothetical protein Cyan7822_0608 [Gloeothece verrucosa PCC 7822]